MEFAINDDDLHLICKLIHDNLQLPVRMLRADRTTEAVFDSLLGAAAHSFDYAWDEICAAIFLDDSPCGVPCYRTWKGIDQYIWLRFVGVSGQEGAIVIGPTVNLPVTDEMLKELLRHTAISAVQLGTVREYYRQLPVRHQKSMLHAGSLLYYLLFRRPLSPAEVIHISAPSPRQLNPMNEQLDRNLTDRRLSLDFHHPAKAWNLLLQRVKEGRTEEVAQYYNSIPRNNIGVLSRKSQLRNEKNLAICLVTHTMQAAIDGGLYPEAGFTASDLWIQHIEDLNTVEEVSQAMNEILLDFTERVSRQRDSAYAKPVSVCQNYIFNRIYEPIKLTELAEAAGIHPAYLSKLFKQETGMTVSEYIQRQKVEEAKKLLNYSDTSPLRAASLLNFHDQSHFTKVFKKHTGVTPKQYKERSF